MGNRRLMGWIALVGPNRSEFSCVLNFQSKHWLLAAVVSDFDLGVVVVVIVAVAVAVDFWWASESELNSTPRRGVAPARWGDPTENHWNSKMRKTKGTGKGKGKGELGFCSYFSLPVSPSQSQSLFQTLPYSFCSNQNSNFSPNLLCVLVID
ncbi:uncharacterized protein LOC130963375 [Arachis stenosperma]|uniref:uncharacterized protein LOC130963375 n=1 Tax=Arachis stenosperma TaxID=217475 RepID=UPI0025ABD560|nr:uncharacterized protein LOC130963375 [Arachis stenosperma]